jgi:hypothetical protein
MMKNQVCDSQKLIQLQKILTIKTSVPTTEIQKFMWTNIKGINNWTYSHYPSSTEFGLEDMLHV